MPKKIGHWLGVSFLKWAMEFLYMTCRVRVIQGGEVVADMLKNRRPIITLFWHNRIFLISPFIREVWQSKGIPYTVLISQSGDGELIANVVERWGADVARGSSSRGGREALMLLTRALKKHKSSIIITPDGPRGPLYEFEAGAIIASQLTQTELVCICVSPRRFWRLNSWDGFLIPKPFTELLISLTLPEIIPRDLDEAGREAARSRLESKMREQRLTLDKLAGVPEYAGKKKKAAKV